MNKPPFGLLLLLLVKAIVIAVKQAADWFLNNFPGDDWFGNGRRPDFC